MDHFPIFLTVRGRRVVVVGAHPSLAGKLALLRKAGADVRESADLDTEDLRDCAAVFIATGEEARDEAAARIARVAGVPVNVVDRPELSTFIMPAVVDRDPVVVAISSGGTSPVLAQRLRERIDAMLPDRLGDLARFAGRFRGAVRRLLPDIGRRRRFWQRFLDSPLAERVLRGDTRADADMIALINRRPEAEEPTAARARRIAI